MSKMSESSYINGSNGGKPIAVQFGETVYELDESHGYINKCLLVGMETKGNATYYLIEDGFSSNERYINAAHLGKTLFATRAEAETAQKKLEVNGACTT